MEFRPCHLPPVLSRDTFQPSKYLLNWASAHLPTRKMKEFGVPFAISTDYSIIRIRRCTLSGCSARLIVFDHEKEDLELTQRGDVNINEISDWMLSFAELVDEDQVDE